MPYYEQTHPDGTSWKVGITLDELIQFGKRLFPMKERDIQYDLAHCAKHYGNQSWIEAILPEGQLRVPYTIEYDYRIDTSSNWGVAILNGNYQFPAELEGHRKESISRFEREGRLSKGDSLCPRVSAFTVNSNGIPIYHIQRARYTDQVGTNLTIDKPFRSPVSVRGHSCLSVREWDRLQSGGLEPTLPKFEMSRLANTIGVAIGITCNTQSGQIALLQRRRAKGVAVYQNMWTSPFGFALVLSRNLPDGEHDLRSIISLDLGHEFGEELGLEPSAFTSPNPIAFCRDLPRGGKPQFFFRMHSSYSLEEIVDRLGSKNPEFRSSVRRVEHLNNSDDGTDISPELMCFATLVAANSGISTLGV